MNRLARASGIAVSALTAATATILLLVPGHARLEFPEATTGASGGAVTSRVTASAGTGAQGGSLAGGHGLTVDGSGRPSGLSGTGRLPGHSRSAGGHDARSAGSLRPALPPISLHLPVVTSVPSPTGTIGDPATGCLHGYVWRQAYSGDYVCVTPATRAQAAADNAQAGNRVALLSLWLSNWTPAAQPPHQNCSGGACATTEGGGDSPNFQINGDHFNFGPVLLQIHRNDGTVLWSTTVSATSYQGFAGAALYARTPMRDCSNVPGTTRNDYAIAYDTVSGRWSNAVPLDSGCASL